MVLFARHPSSILRRWRMPISDYLEKNRTSRRHTAAWNCFPRKVDQFWREFWTNKFWESYLTFYNDNSSIFTITTMQQIYSSRWSFPPPTNWVPSPSSLAAPAYSSPLILCSSYAVLCMPMHPLPLPELVLPDPSAADVSEPLIWHVLYIYIVTMLFTCLAWSLVTLLHPVLAFVAQASSQLHLSCNVSPHKMNFWSYIQPQSNMRVDSSSDKPLIHYNIVLHRTLFACIRESTIP